MINLDPLRKSGVMIFIKGKGAISYVILEGQDIAEGEQRDCSHCAITGTVNGNIEVVEMVWPKIRHTPLSDWMKAYKDEIVDILVCKPTLTIKENLDLDVYLNQEIQKKVKYGIFDLLGFLFKPFVNIQKRALVCSALLATAMKTILRILIPGKNVNRTSPEDLLATKDKTTVSIYREVFGVEPLMKRIIVC